MAAFAIARFSFFGRDSVSFIFVLPIALPGIITGMALNSFFTFNHIDLSLWTIVVGHATFCVVIVYNNVLARLRRPSPSLPEPYAYVAADVCETLNLVIWWVLS